MDPASRPLWCPSCVLSALCALFKKQIATMGSYLKMINPQSDVTRKNQALSVNISAGKGLQEVLKSNLGPRGTLKMYDPPQYIYLCCANLLQACFWSW